MPSSQDGYDPLVKLLLEEHAAEMRRVKLLMDVLLDERFKETTEEDGLDVSGLGCGSNKTLRYNFRKGPRYLIFFHSNWFHL